MRLQVLGPMRFWTGSDWAPVPGPRPRTLLALLTIDMGRPVSTAHMVSELWPANPPATAPTLIRGYVSQLRRALGDLGDDTILTRPSGYEMPSAPEATDVSLFDALTSQGSTALVKGAAEEAHRLLSQALALWRGEPYSDALLTSRAAAEVSRLGERRLVATEAHIEAGLLCGRGHELIHELQCLTSEHPLREGLWAQLMRALYAADRRAAALDSYRRARQALVGELGLEPGPDLRELHQAILEGSPLPGPAPAHTPAPRGRASDAPAPASLPLELRRDVAAFIGRQQDLASLQRLMTGSRRSSAVVITGAGGMGKSALAIHLAHRLRDHFPDGQLHLCLQGTGEGLKPLQPAEALSRMLRALGVAPADVPAEPDEAAARFRSLTSGRSMLVLLDNAVDAAQIEPLLPGDPCAVLVTSRRSLSTLDGTVHLLNNLSEQESLLLLGRLAGEERITTDPDAALRIVRYCEGLPLAVRIAGARLAARPHWPLRWLADRLSSEQHRLDELQIDGLAVRSAFAVSLHDLEADPSGRDQSRLFRLLGLSHRPYVTGPLAAALTGTTVDQAEWLLEKLLDARLLESLEPSSYRMHDLMRLFAKEQASLPPSSSGTGRRTSHDGLLSHDVGPCGSPAGASPLR
ncbi:AfsR/SARP family transcriptional regulator [Sphaerisporangium dianthi]|uniref:BTAD domain-containing putative transcriptional regulator n=1 Tax=Sphaerisporangium dianthi TaxID=1436120 RepID=A0ABV9C9X0_9ACTN